MRSKKNAILVLIALALAAGIGIGGAQRWGGGRWSEAQTGPMILTEGRQWVNEDTIRTARDTARHSVGFDNWTNAPGFDRDVFTFTRVIFKSTPGRPPWFGWINDYPDSDLNLSFRLHQLTSIKVNPDGRVIRLTDPELFKYPMIHMAKPGRIELGDDEVSALRRYLRAGGALMADDFWGADEWAQFEFEMDRVLPGHRWVELPMEHPIFHCVFDLSVPKNKLQVPYIRAGVSSLNPSSWNFGSSAQYAGVDYQEMHVRAWLDERDRIMVIATHNTNNGDGWEREGENTEYFHEYSENRAYPLAINIIFYIMTH